MDGWNYSAFPNGILPAASDLDGLTGGRPAFLVAYDYHTIWMNKEALKAFGITKATKSVSFAEDVQHDKITGEPTGILVGLGKTDYPPEEFKDVVAKLDKRGLQIFTHAIGDRGIRTALDAYGYARKVNGPRDSRHEIVHAECLSEQDIPRFKALGVTACMQPRHCAPDITGQWAKAVGPQRWKYAWAFRSLRDSGATLAFARDWNVAEMEPEIGIYTALTRKGLDGKPVGGWIPEQTIDIEAAVKGYTINGAQANFVEHDRGTLVPGKYADLVLLSDDLFSIPPDKTKDSRVLWTVVGGKEVFRAFY